MHLEEVSSIKITNIKIKNNKVTIQIMDNFNNEDKLKISYDLYSLYKLDINKEIDINTWKEIINKINEEEIKEYIIKIYNNKTISIYELKNKTNKKYRNNELLIDNLINELHYNDINFVKEYYSYLSKELYGKYYILNFFRLNEVDKELMKDLDFSDSKEFEKASKYVKKLMMKNKSNFMKLKVKIYSRLSSRGYDQDIIIKVLSGLNINEEDERNSLKKDLDKIVNKELKKKGEIDYKVLNKKLISKGYKFSDVSEAIARLKGERND